MPPKGDPFNFDDLYIAAGAENLVKKTMSEMKRSNTGSSLVSNSAKASPSTMAAATKPGMSNGHGSSPALAKSTATSASTVALPHGALDFLETFANTPSKPATAASSARPSMNGIADPFGDLASAPVPSPGIPRASRPSGPAPHTTGPAASFDDPFSMFGDLPGAQTVAQPAKATAATTTDLGFDDFADFSQVSKPAAVAPVPSKQFAEARQSNDSDFQPFQAATNVTPAQPQAGSPSLTQPTGQFASSSQPAPESTRLPISKPAHDSYSRLSHASSATPASRTDDIDRHQSYSSSAGGGVAGGGGYYTSSYDSYDRHDRDYESSGYVPNDRVPSKTSAKPASVLGFMKDLGKKAVKAAQAGLHQLETALEKLEHNQPSHSTQQGHSTAQHEGAWDSRPQAPQHAYDARVDSYERTPARNVQEEAQCIAVDLLALSPAERRVALQEQVPSEIRERVRIILADLTHGEHEPSRSGSGGTLQQNLSVDIKTNAVDFSSFGAPAKSSSPANSRAVAQPPSVETDDLVSVRSKEIPARTAPPAANNGRPTPATSVEHGDLLGMPGNAASVTSSQSAARPAPAAPAAVVDDLLGFDGPSAAPAVTASRTTSAAPTQAASAVADVDDLHDFFSGGSAAAAAPPSAPAKPAVAPQTSSAPADVADFFASSTATKAAPTSRSAAAAASKPGPSVASPLMDLHSMFDDPVSVQGHEHLYADTEAQDGEPEIRRQLRAARLAEKHAKMQAALANKLAVEAAEAAAKEEQVVLKEQLKATVDTWKNKNKGNIRGLLGSLQTVLWEESGWKTVSVGDMLDPGQIRKVWMRANLLVHPDKVRQRNGSPEQVARADMIFDVLKDAWNVFQSTGR